MADKPLTVLEIPLRIRRRDTVVTIDENTSPVLRVHLVLGARELRVKLSDRLKVRHTSGNRRVTVCL